MSSLSARRPKCHPIPPPPPSPVLLRLPRGRLRRQHVATETGGNSAKFPLLLLDRGKRREKVAEDEEEIKEKWRFQADVLRAECGLLRKERENAVMEMKENKRNMETTLRSALHIIGKTKCDGSEGSRVVNEETEDLEENLEELLGVDVKTGDSETKKPNNFNKKAFILQKRLEKLGGESKNKPAKEIREMVQASFPLKPMHKYEDRSSVSDQNNCYKCFDVEVLRRKMEGISKGVYERMEEEYGAMLVSNTHTPSTSKRFKFPDDSSSLSTRPSHPEQGTKKCSGQCKMIVRKIMEQVREESKQWSEMQEMLVQVKKEMDQLRFSRDFWQNRALQSEQQIQSLHSSAQEWKRKAVTIRSKAKLLKREVYARRRELSNYREVQKVEKTTINDGPKMISLGAQIAKEKRELVYRMKEKENYRSASREFEQENLNDDGRRKSQIFDHGPVGLKRLPFQDIGNSASPKTRINGKKSTLFVETERERVGIELIGKH